MDIRRNVGRLRGASRRKEPAEIVQHAFLHRKAAGRRVAAVAIERLRRGDERVAHIVTVGRTRRAVPANDYAYGDRSTPVVAGANALEYSRGDYARNALMALGQVYDLRRRARNDLGKRGVEHRLLDGGLADSMPLQWFQSQGYDRNVVILTQPAGYQKGHNRLMPLMRMSLRHYPNMVRALDQRHIMYNKELEYVAQREQAGAAYVIRPDSALRIGHISHNPAEMQAVYDEGRKKGEAVIADIKAFLEKE